MSGNATSCLASLAVHVISIGSAALVAPLIAWLAAIALLLVWILVAIASGRNNRKPVWLFLLTGIVTLAIPTIGLLHGEWCLIVGRCVF